MSKRAGERKPQRTVFAPEQNRALRAALRSEKRAGNRSQVSLGELLGTTQQNIGRLLASDDAGFSYDTATRLVRALGYAGVDEFFRSKRISSVAPPCFDPR